MARKDTRIAIINAAVKLFADKGFESTTVDEVATEAKVAKGTVFYNFKSKEDIFFSILQFGLEELTEIVEQSAEKGVTATEKLENVFDATVEFLLRSSSFCAVLMSELGRVRSRWNTDPILLLEPYRKCVEKILVEGQRAKEFREDIKPEEVGLILLLVICSDVVGRIVLPEHTEINLTGSTRRILLKGMCP